MSSKRDFLNILENVNSNTNIETGDAIEHSNYRRIALTKQLSKPLETVVFKHVFTCIQRNNAVYLFQLGFLPGHCTTYQMLEIYNKITSVMNNDEPNQKCCGVTLCIRVVILVLVSNRTQCVSVPAILPELISFTSGVLHGSVLRRLPFIANSSYMVFLIVLLYNIMVIVRYFFCN